MERIHHALPRTSYVHSRARAYNLGPRARVLRRHQSLDRSNFINYITGDKTMNYRQPIHKSQRAMLCLLIAAHNEEMVLENTLRSAIAAGMKPEHIYVVDDCSTDPTTKIARTILPHDNVHKVRRSGKGLALSKANKKFRLTDRYRWIHIADADGAFAPNYFSEFRKNLRVENAAATGYIKSLPGKRISEYRVFEYTVGMELHRRIQSLLGVISIVPGPTSCFRSDVFAQLDFTTGAMTEDFDVTLQMYRKGLGKIQFIPSAIAYTQDPLNTKSFIKQITRWNRGVLQGVVRHNIGRKASPIDAYLTYQISQSLLLVLNCFIWVPYMMLSKGGTSFLATSFIMDVLLTFLITLMVCMRTRRWDAMSAFPIIYGLKWLSLLIFVKAFVEVVILRKFKISKGYWENGTGRRYKLATS